MTRVQKALIVDDDEDVRALCRASLGSLARWTLLFAESAMDAIDLAAREAPDVILLDLRMPDADGFAVLRALGAREITAKIPVILMTGAALSPSSRRRPGVAGFIAKPFDPLSLARDVERLVREATS